VSAMLECCCVSPVISWQLRADHGHLHSVAGFDFVVVVCCLSSTVQFLDT